MIKVLFVCLGNICRSPLAEAVFRHKVNSLKLNHVFEIDSCGTGDYHIGDQPDRRTIKVATKNGVPINHACRQLIAEDLEYFDYVLAMDKSNYNNILRLAESNEHHSKVQLMRNFDPAAPGTEVPDPYWGGDADFQHVFDILNRSLDNFIGHVKQQHGL